jgi:hypothetical protein
MSIILKKSSLARLGNVRPIALSEVFSEDEKLLVLGPFFETETVSGRLEELGLKYIDDYFDLPHTGGDVPEWCQISLSYKKESP